MTPELAEALRAAGFTRSDLAPHCWQRRSPFAVETLWVSDGMVNLRVAPGGFCRVTAETAMQMAARGEL